MFRTLFILILSSLSWSALGQQSTPNIWKKYQTKATASQFISQNTFALQSKHLFNYDVHFYWLNLQISSQSTFVKGNVRITASVSISKLDTFAIELIPAMVIDSAFINTIKMGSFMRDGTNVIFPIIAPIQANENFTVQIYYHGRPPAEGFFSGVTQAHNTIWDKDVCWTLSEPFNAKEWFPVKQSLEDKADSVWVFLTTPGNEMAGSEGLLSRVVNLPDGMKRFEWKTSYPIDYYLISFAVSNYQDYSCYAHPEQMNDDSLLIQNFVYNAPGYLASNKTDIDQTAKLIELYSKLFGLYPFSKEKYGHCLTELGGGMEHQTMTTIGGFGFDLVAHELGHMWFGDNVTCATWSDIWVNEGFATYANYLSNEYLKGPVAADNFILRAQISALSQPGGSIYIPENEIYPGNEFRIFNGRLSYDKGATIIHMLRHEINNDSLFFKILKSYQKRYGGGVATGKNFEQVVDSITQKGYTYFFNQWYYGEGYPIYSIQWNQSNGVLTMKSIQNTSTQTTNFFKMTQDFLIRFKDNSDTTIRLQQSDNVSSFEIPISKSIQNIEVDPNHWNLQKVNSIVIEKVSEISNPACFSLYPNPASRYTHLLFGDHNTFDKKISLITTNGRQLWNIHTQKSSIELNLTDYPKGIYVLTAVVNNKHFFRKIVHQ